jgi:hypothetical protein
MSLSIEPYVTVEEAETYFSERPESADWFDLTGDEQLAYLKAATRAIERLKFAGTKTVTTQLRQFPRYPSLLVPDEIKIATCEVAFNLIDGTNMEQEIENLAVVDQSYGAVRTSYHPEIVVEHMRAGIPSAIAWSYLRPFLSDPNKITIKRG